MRSKLKINILVMCILAITTIIFPQTQSFRIEWELGSETNLDQYFIYRSTTPNPTTLIGTVAATANSYTDTNLEKGILYYYRLRVQNTENIFSGFSSVVSSAIPEITGFTGPINIPVNNSITISLDEHVTDPDDLDSSILWSISGQNNLIVSIQNRLVIITPVNNWFGEEILTFRAEDPGGCYDVINVPIRANPTAPPRFSTISVQNFNEDTQGQLYLLDYVSDIDSEDSTLTFSVSQGNNLSLSIIDNILLITPATDWFGSESVEIVVNDETDSSDVTSFIVNVNPVNDAPILENLPDAIFFSDSTYTLSISEFITDVDNDLGDLSWNFVNNQQIQLEMDDTNEILIISAINESHGMEYIYVSVSDFESESNIDTMEIVFSERNRERPVILNFPEILFDEDDEAFLFLSEFVDDPNDPNQNLFWNTERHDIINVDINQSTKFARFTALENWYGIEEVWLYVTDPAQNMDSVQILISVNPINDSPVLIPISNINLSTNVNVEIDLKEYVSDPDNSIDDLSWSYSLSPNVVVTISNAGIASISTSDSWYGQTNVQVYVSDLEGAQDSLGIIIYRQDIARAPVITGLNNIFISEDSLYFVNISDHFSDPDNDLEDLQILVYNSAFITITVDATSNQLIFTPDLNWNGTEYITIEVTDPDGNVGYSDINITVENINDAPVFNQIGNKTIIGNTTLTIPLNNYIFDADGLDDISEIEIFSSNNNIIGYFLDKTSYQLTFFAPSGIKAAESFMLRICDDGGLEASNIFLVEVIEKNIAGQIDVNYFGAKTNLSLRWETIQATRDFIEYGFDTQYGNRTTQEFVPSQDHNHLLSNLAENSEFHFRIVSESENGILYSADSVFYTGSSLNDEVNVFPLPYVKSKDIDDKGIFFTNLPENAKIQIYNLLGEPVFKKEELSFNYRWSVDNNYGKKISSGLYLYVINDRSNKVISSGKIVVVR